MYKPHTGTSLQAVAQAADVYSFRSYVAAAAMLLYLIASLDGSRADEKESPIILSDCLLPTLLNLHRVYAYCCA